MTLSHGKSYAARWLFPVDAPPIERGTLTVADGKIVAVEPHGARSADVDLGNVAILPGFVNAHTHLDLSGARGQCPPTPDFTQWLRSVVAFRRARTPEQVQADIAMGLAECLRFGTTLIGDIAAGGASWELLRQAPCRAVVFHELLGLSIERAKQALQSALDWQRQHPPSDRCVAGLSPHAPYSVRSTQYAVVGARAPIATHLAETEAELDLLNKHAGSLVTFLKEMNVWDPTGLVADTYEVIQMMPRGIFVHGNYLHPTTPFTSGQSLVVCPRTHAAFGHPHHSFPQMRVRVALGTDSLASNPNLDMLAEARHVRQHYPEVEPARLLRMLTLSGAEALGFDSVTGSLSIGKSADFVVLPVPDAETRDPHELVFDSTLPIRAAYFQGERTFAESIP